MICQFCLLEADKFDWDMTSHKGKRVICISCIKDRDRSKMLKNGAIVLSLKDNKLTNAFGNLSFRIREKKKTKNIQEFSFSFKGNPWIGLAYDEIPGMVYCRRLPSDVVRCVPEETLKIDGLIINN